MYAPESGTSDQALGPAHFIAAIAGIGLPIVTAAVLVTALFSPGLWTSVPLVMLAVLIANLANLLFFGFARRRPMSDRFRDLLSIGAIFSGICLSAVLVLASWFAMLGA